MWRRGAVRCGEGRWDKKKARKAFKYSSRSERNLNHGPVQLPFVARFVPDFGEKRASGRPCSRPPAPPAPIRPTRSTSHSPQTTHTHPAHADIRMVHPAARAAAQAGCPTHAQAFAEDPPRSGIIRSQDNSTQSSTRTKTHAKGKGTDHGPSPFLARSTSFSLQSRLLSPRPIPAPTILFPSFA